MANHVWSVLCSRAIIDEESHQVSLIAIIEEIHVRGSEEQVLQTIAQAKLAKGRVAVGQKMELVTYWVRSNYGEPEMGTARIAIQVPNGDFLPWQEIALDLQVKTGWRVRVLLPGVPMSGAGLYRFHVQQKIGPDQWNTVAQIPFTVDFQPVQAQPGEMVGAVEPIEA